LRSSSRLMADWVWRSAMSLYYTIDRGDFGGPDFVAELLMSAPRPQDSVGEFKI
jgi:hypothetical protein